MKAKPIEIWNRETARFETEQVLGEGAVRFLYETRTGQALVDRMLSRPLFSRVYGSYQSSSHSQRKIEPFIKNFNIPMDEFEAGPFSCFNDFFIRKFRPGARPIANEPSRMPAFAEARYFAFESTRPDQTFPVKGIYLTADALLGGSELAQPFRGGPLLLARLCPVDYHRFHFPDDGVLVRAWRIPGRLHSVNPVALGYRGDIFAINERHVSLLQTQNFGTLAYIEVGALCVGRIVDSWNAQADAGKFRRGEEKGYFLFGGSTVIVLGEPGRWRPDADLLAQTTRHRETRVKLGAAIATAI